MTTDHHSNGPTEGSSDASPSVEIENRSITGSMVVPPPPGHAPRQRWKVAAAIATAVVVLLGLGVYFVPAESIDWLVPGESVVDDGAVALKPGSVRDTVSKVSIEGLEIFEPVGEVRFTTVAIDDNVKVWEWIQANTDDAIELLPRDDFFGDRTPEQNRERNIQMMQSSKDAAILVALDRLGVDVFDITGVGFLAVAENGPAVGLLEAGDVIVGLDDVAVTDLASLRAALEQRAPGDSVVLTLEDAAGTTSRTEQIVLGVHPDGLPGGFIGIANVQERVVDVDLPVDVSIDSGSVGGPSAGLAFTLTLLDLLTPGELTGGRDIAVTGTIDLNGSVGNVGGVRQKSAAARSSGADAFIVPEASLEEAVATAGDMTVIGVATLEEALDALADLGGETSELALSAEVLERIS